MEDHKEFLDAWDEATKPVIEKYKRTLAPAFQFGDQLLPGKFVVQKINDEVSDESKTNGQSDSGDKAS